MLPVTFSFDGKQAKSGFFLRHRLRGPSGGCHPQHPQHCCQQLWVIYQPSPQFPPWDNDRVFEVPDLS